MAAWSVKAAATNPVTRPMHKVMEEAARKIQKSCQDHKKSCKRMRRLPLRKDTTTPEALKVSKRGLDTAVADTRLFASMKTEWQCNAATGKETAFLMVSVFCLRGPC